MLKGVLEGLLFAVGDEGLTKQQMLGVLEVDEIKLNELILSLEEDYKNDTHGIELMMLGDHLKMVTKKEHKAYLQKLMTLSENDNLSEAALEVLAIIAYNQPVTRSMIDEIRGISSSHMVRKLVYKNLIEEIGRSETAGRPILYGTTSTFLDYFGLKSVSDLPQITITKEDNVLELYDSKYTENENS